MTGAQQGPNLDTLPAGTRIGRYALTGLLGQGGFGVTYLAEHQSLQRRVAIKEHFPREFATRSGPAVQPHSHSAATFKWARERFLDEARTLSGFRHPAINEVLDVFEANGTAYMVLAFEDALRLGDWLEGLRRPPAQAEIDRIAGPLCEALELIHARSFLHRDIAPDNILIRRDGAPVLIDFGAARQAMGKQTRTLTAVIKPGYSPPEQYDTDDSTAQGPWTDIYAFAATLYRAVTGGRPPESTGRVLTDKYVSAQGVANRGYRRTFLSAIDQGLRVHPDARPRSVAEWRPLLLDQRQVAPVPAADPRTLQIPVHSSGPTAPIAPLPAAQRTTSAPPPRPIGGERPSRRGARTAIYWLGCAALGTAALHYLFGIWSSTLGPGTGGLVGGLLTWASAAFLVLRRGARITGVELTLYALGCAFGLFLPMESLLLSKFGWAAKPYDLLAGAAVPSAVALLLFLAHRVRAPIGPGIAALGLSGLLLAGVWLFTQPSFAQKEVQRRHAAAAAEWNRIKTTQDETEIERFIADNSDAPVTAEARVAAVTARQRLRPGQGVFINQVNAFETGTDLRDSQSCRQRCLANARCQSFEFHRDLWECRLYDRFTSFVNSPRIDAGRR